MSALFFVSTKKKVYSVIAESIQQARVAMGRRAYGESRVLLSEALSSEPDNFEARYTLAVLERAEGNYDKAIELLNVLTAEKPDFGRGFQEMGLCELALKHRIYIIGSASSPSRVHSG